MTKLDFSEPMNWHTYDHTKFSDFPTIREKLANDIAEFASEFAGNSITHRAYVIPGSLDYAEIHPDDIRRILYSLDQTRIWLHEAISKLRNCSE